MNAIFEHHFAVTHCMVAAFARFTGDWNALHTNPEVARRYRYRKPVVHGMLPVSFLALIQKRFEGAGLEFVEISGRFKKPVYPGERLSMRVAWSESDSGGYDFFANWFRGIAAEVVTTCRGRFRLTAKPHSAASAAPCDGSAPWVEKLEERLHSIEDLSESAEGFSFSLSPANLAAFGEALLGADEQHAGEQPVPSRSLAAVLLLSTLVGMRLPGRNATFVRFSLAFSPECDHVFNGRLAGRVRNLSRASETMKADVELAVSGQVCATGSVDVIVNTPPQAMPCCAEIRDRHTQLRLDGKVTIVTGASRGIGETTAKLLAMLGATVHVGYYRGEQDARAVAEEIVACGGEAYAVHCDVRDEFGVAALIDQVVKTHGRIDLLINNAVGEFSPCPVEQLEWKDIQAELDVSVKGLHVMCSAVIPVMKATGGGKIINFSTMAVHNPVTGQSRYMVAKGAVEIYTRSLAVELARYNIQANVVVPNMTETDLVAGIPSAYRDKIAEQRPGGRHVRPIEVAQAVAYLASPWADAMMGQRIVLNMGESVSW